MPDGTLVKGTMGPFDLRLEDEATAKDLKVAVIDMLFELPVKNKMGEVRGIVGVVLTDADAAYIQFFAPGGLPTFMLDKKTGRTTLAIEPSQDGRLIGRHMGIMLRAGAGGKQPRGGVE